MCCSPITPRRSVAHRSPLPTLPPHRPPLPPSRSPIAASRARRRSGRAGGSRLCGQCASRRRWTCRAATVPCRRDGPSPTLSLPPSFRPYRAMQARFRLPVPPSLPPTLLPALSPTCWPSLRSFASSFLPPSLPLIPADMRSGVDLLPSVTSPSCRVAIALCRRRRHAPRPALV